MGDEDEGDAETFLEVFEFDLHGLAQAGVECGEGFVQEQDLGLADDGAGEGDALLLAAGKLGRFAVLQSSQRNEIQGVFDAVFNLRLGEAAHAEAEGDVFIDAHVGEEGVGLENLVDVALVRWETGDVVMVEEDSARVGGFEA